MGRAGDWLGRKVRDPLLAQLRQGATPEAVSAAVVIAFALAIVPVIGVTTLLCLLAAGPMMKLMGAKFEGALTRLLGVVLAALAAQFVIDGIKQSFGL